MAIVLSRAAQTVARARATAITSRRRSRTRIGRAGFIVYFAAKISAFELLLHLFAGEGEQSFLFRWIGVFDKEAFEFLLGNMGQGATTAAALVAAS